MNNKTFAHVTCIIGQVLVVDISADRVKGQGQSQGPGFCLVFHREQSVS